MPSPEHHIRRDLLPPQVRSYADKLQTERFDLLRQNHVKYPDDLLSLERNPKTMDFLRRYRDLTARLREVVQSGKLPDDYPIVEFQDKRIDLHEILKASSDFYTSHNLQVLVDALPETPDTLSDEQRRRITFALEQGFTSALILPPPELLLEQIDVILEQAANQPSGMLKGNDQYTTPKIDPEAKFLPSHNRPPSPYLLLYSSGPIPPETKYKTFQYLTKTFQTKGWNGLTTPEYLLVQRKEAEQRGNHTWDTNADDHTQSNWTWLLDSRSHSSTASAYWNPGVRRVRVRCLEPVVEYPRLGARPTVVVGL